MADLSPSAGQALAINIRNKNVLVSAAAGSGKTYVLVQRVMSMLKDMDTKINIDNLLIVTFTNKAAAEMRERIGKALNEAIREESLKKDCNEALAEHLRRQLVLLSRANISTIDAFCAMVVKRNFHLVDLDPDFRTVTSDETVQLKKEVMEELLEKKYSEGREEFIALSDYFSPQYSDEELENIIYSIYNVSCAQPYPIKWLKECRKMYDDTEQGVYSTVWGKLLKDEILKKLYRAKEIHETALRLYTQSKGAHKHLENVLILAENSDRVIINTLIDKCKKGTDSDFQDYISEISYARSGYDRNSTVPKETVDAINLLRGIFKDIIGEIYSPRSINQSLFPYGEETANAIEKAQAPIMRELIDTVIEFSEMFYERKMEEQLAEFSDIEHMCLNILRNDDGSTTASAKELQEQFYEIIIDEYQDSNYLQEEILTAVSKRERGINNMFMVGDIKQAIYRFRMATPEIFTEKYESYSTDINSGNVLIPLSENYRSRASVLKSCNFLFYQLMSRELGEIDYDNRAALYAKAPYPSAEENDFNDKTEVYIIDSPSQSEDIPLDSNQCSALFTAYRISQMLKTHKVWNMHTEEYENLRPRDIAILLKDRKYAESYAEALAERGIPAVVDKKGSPLVQTYEVSTIIALLNIIDNPMQDIYLIQVLTSPIYSLDSNELAMIRINSDERLFYRAVLAYAENIQDELSQKLRKFLKDIADFREYARCNTISALIAYIYDYTDFYSYCGILENGSLRQSDLRAFQETVGDFEKNQGFNITKLINYMNDASLQQTSAVSEGADAVRIMTIHGSKGLEFPVVFVPELNRPFNKRDYSENLLIDRGYGIAARHFDTKYRTRTVSVPYTLLKIKGTNELLSEEMRLLYVALTRAKEKLILIGSVNKAEEKLAKFAFLKDRKETALPPALLFGYQSRIMWILMALVRKEIFGADEFMESSIITPSEIYRLCSEGTEEAAEKLTELIRAEDTGENTELYKNLSYVYPCRELHSIPAKISISEIKRMQAEEEDTYYYYNSIEPFMSDKEDSGKIKGAARGTIYHSILEHMDFKSINNEKDIKDLLDSLKNKGILSQEEIDSVSMVKLSRFTDSPLYKRIQASESIYKEAPFVMKLSSEEIYGNRYDTKTDIIVHGIIDLYFTEGDSIVLVDYKSDYVPDHNTDLLIKRYKIQLELYKRAIEQNTGKKVKEAIIYSIYEDSEIQCI